MSRTLVDRIADAVLYEGYVLYPYRPSVKNRQRWTFGGLAPEGGADASASQTECLLGGGPGAAVGVTVRYLHLTDRRVGEFAAPLPRWPDGDVPTFRPAESLRVDGQIFQTWQEAEERRVSLSDVTLGEIRQRPARTTFSLSGRRWLEPIAGAGGQIVGVLERRQYAVEGEIELSAIELAEGLFRLTLRVRNLTPLCDIGTEGAAMRNLASTHAVLTARGGRFVSLLGPPDEWRDHAAACKNVGVWPVLVGEPGQSDTMLSSPIILYDHPQVAPESPGDLFDGTEIDEILSLRILTLTDDEKRQAAAIDGRVRALLKRTESLSAEQLGGLHGTFREYDRRRVECVHIGSAEVRAGGRVRLRPRGRADAFDLLLAGMDATVEAIEQDFDGRIYLAVTIDDDPGRDLGALRQPGHRFFFAPEDVEALP